MGDYWLLVKFLVPLAFTSIAIDVGEQALNRGVAFSENVTASYGLAFTLTKFLSGPVHELKNVGLVLVHDQRDGRAAVLSTAALGCLTAGIHLLIALTPLGYLLIETAHQVDSVVGEGTRRAMLLLTAFPLLEGLSWMLAGVTLQHRHTVVVAAGSIADVCLQVGVTLGLMATRLQADDPLLIPVLAGYAGVLSRFGIVLGGFLCKVYPRMRQLQPLEAKDSFTVLRALKFWWPLGMVAATQKVSRPVVNLLVSRDLGGQAAVDAVAVLTVSYPVGHLPYSWLNDLRLVGPAFRKKGGHIVPWSTLRKFAVLCALLVLVVACILFFVPGITFWLMTSWIETSASIARMTREPLRIFAFFAIPVSIRAHLTSWLMVYKQTWILSLSCVLRVIALVVSLIVLPKAGVRGGTMGTAALLTGFWAETVVVIIGFFFIRRKVRAQEKLKDSEEEEERSSGLEEKSGEQLLSPTERETSV